MVNKLIVETIKTNYKGENRLIMYKYFIMVCNDTLPSRGIYKIHPLYKNGFDDIEVANNIFENLKDNPTGKRGEYFNLSLFRKNVALGTSIFENIKNYAVKIL